VDEYSTVITIEGSNAESPDPLQVAFMTSGAVHCGFCTPGFIVSAYGLLQEKTIIQPEKRSETGFSNIGTCVDARAISR
jgi:aerobic-type carbon monoxide dehydrogenase small subunit (CoxS/CutS family)